MATGHHYVTVPLLNNFATNGNRAVNYLFAAVGDKHLRDYTRADANALRDFLIKRGLVNTSVKRNFEVVRAIFNLAEREHALIQSGQYFSVIRGSIFDMIYDNPEKLLSKYQCIFYPTHPKWVIFFVVCRFNYLQKHSATEQSDCGAQEIPSIKTHNIA